MLAIGPAYRSITQAVDEVELTILLQTDPRFHLEEQKNFHSIFRPITSADVQHSISACLTWEGLRVTSVVLSAATFYGTNW